MLKLLNGEVYFSIGFLLVKVFFILNFFFFIVLFNFFRDFLVVRRLFILIININFAENFFNCFLFLGIGNKDREYFFVI